MNQFACGVTGQRSLASGHFAGRSVCYPVTERCNYQLYCADGSDERDCTVCQPGTFHCDSDRSVCGRRIQLQVKGVIPQQTHEWGDFFWSAGVCLRAGTVTARWTARTEQTS